MARKIANCQQYSQINLLTAIDMVCYTAIHNRKGVFMKNRAESIKMIVTLPKSLKSKLDTLRAQGTTASGFIRWLLEQHFKQAEFSGRKGR